MPVAVELPARGPAARFPIVERLTRDIDGYRASAAGVELDMVRGGPDQRPSRIRGQRLRNRRIIVANVRTPTKMINQKTGWAGSEPCSKLYLVNRKEMIPDRMVNPVIINGIMI